MIPDPLSPSAASPLQAGQIIGERYLVGEVLGGGGMGVVWAGTHVLLGTPVAIKVIHTELKSDSEVVHRFINEARAAAALKGEHIARVFDVGALGSGEPYLVMEQLEGVSLDHYLAGRGPLTRREAVDIVLQVCEGLAEAHAAGVVHRDIKPGNLFLAQRPDEQLSAALLPRVSLRALDSTTPADVPEERPLLMRESPRLLQYLHEADAVPELERPGPAPAPPAPRENDDWPRADQLKRLHDLENRYGL